MFHFTVLGANATCMDLYDLPPNTPINDEMTPVAPSPNALVCSLQLGFDVIDMRTGKFPKRTRMFVLFENFD